MENDRAGRPYSVVGRKETKIGRFTVVQDILEINKTQYPFSYIREKDCVCVLPVIDGKAALINQYRHAVNAWQLELPCGAIDDGETPDNAARRELLEETGCVVDWLINLGDCYVRAGVSDAKVTFFLAYCSEMHEAAPEGAELIESRLVPVEKLPELIEAEVLTQQLGVSCWLRARKHLEREEYP